MGREVWCPACGAEHRLGPGSVVLEEEAEPAPPSTVAEAPAETAPARESAPAAGRAWLTSHSLRDARSIVAFAMVLIIIVLGTIAVYLALRRIGHRQEPDAADPVALAVAEEDTDPYVGSSTRVENGVTTIERWRRSGKVEIERTVAPLPTLPATPVSTPLADRFRVAEPGGAAHQRGPHVGSVVRRVGPSLAWVGGKVGGGTGCLVRRGLVATTTRAVSFDLPSDLKVWFPAVEDAARGPFDADLVVYDRQRDVALVALQGDVSTLPPPFEFPADLPASQGMLLRVANVGGADSVFTRPVEIRESPGDPARVMPILGGPLPTSDLGGPLIDPEGRAFGIVTTAPGPGRTPTLIRVEGPGSLILAHRRDRDEDFHRARSLHRMIVTTRRLMMALALHTSALEARARCLRDGDETVDAGGGEHRLSDYLGRISAIDRDAFAGLEGELSSVRGYSPSQIPELDRSKFGLAADLIHEMRRLVREAADDPGRYAEKVDAIRLQATELIRDHSTRWDIDPPGFLWPVLEGTSLIDPERFFEEITHWVG